MRGIVRVVTGGGKTIFAQFCIGAFKERYPSGRVIIIVPTTALLDQWVVSLTEDFSVPAHWISCYSAEEKPEKPSPINVLVINTARQLAPRLMQGQPSMLIVDECHRAGSEKNALALAGQYFATLGLSATPEREYDEGFNSFVKPALGDVIYDYDYVEASKHGVIAQFALHNVRVQMLSDEQNSFDKLSRRISIEHRKLRKREGSELKYKRLLLRRAAVLATATMRIPAAVKIAEQHLGKRTIIFHERLDSANQLIGILTARNRSVTGYHSGIAPPLRRDNLRLYRKGIFDILVCCRALDEGINVPETTVAIIASSTASIRQRIQRLGRVLRPAPGKQFAEVYTIYASDVEQRRLQHESEKLRDICAVDWAQVRK